MFNDDDKYVLIRAMEEMMHEQLATPLSGLLDSLLINLLTRDAIDCELLEKQLSSLISGLEGHQVGGPGDHLLRRYRLLARKGADGSILQALSSAERTADKKPDWFRGVIQGGLSDSDPVS